MSDFALSFIPGGEEEKPKPAQPNTSLVDQAGAGAVEGLSGFVGLPMDIAGGIKPVRLIDRIFGTNFDMSDEAQEAVGRPPLGTAARYTQDATNAGLITDVPPQTGTQRFARDVMTEVGADTIPALLTAGTAGPGAAAMASILSALGGSGAAVATEAMGAPEWVQNTARLAGNVVGGSLATRPKRPQTPSYEDVDSLARDKWSAVENSDMRLTPEGRDDLVNRLDSRFRYGKLSERVSERNTPKALDALDDAATLPAMGPAGPHIYGDVVDYRRAVSRNVAGAIDPSERRLGTLMKRELDDFLQNLAPGQAAGTDVAGTVDDLRTANDASRRVMNADLLMDELDRAGRRAARSGRGGNTVNTVRQNIDKILNNDNMRAGFTDADLSLMEDIVKGTKPINALRHISGLAPSTGVLPAMGNLAAGGVAAFTGNPLLMLPGIIGEAAKVGADTMTGRQTRELIAQVLNGAPIPKAARSDAQKAIIAALMAGQAGSANMQQSSQGPR